MKDIIYNKYEERKENILRHYYLKFTPKWIQSKRHVHKWKRSVLEPAYNLANSDGVLSRLPKSIELETMNRCNGTCPFCPVNVKNDTRKLIKMEKELFYKIINDLAALEYDGRICLFSNNEPFLDDRMEDFLKYTREKLPKSFLYIFTNATMLPLEKFLRIVECLDLLVIDNYNDNLELNKNPKEIYEYCQKHHEYDDVVQIHLRKINEVLSTRGGQSPNNTKKKHGILDVIFPLNKWLYVLMGSCHCAVMMP